MCKKRKDDFDGIVELFDLQQRRSLLECLILIEDDQKKKDVFAKEIEAARGKIREVVGF